MGIAGKTVLVTGASRGIGAATALHLAASGARVVAASRNLPRLEEMAAAASGSPGEVVAVAMDVRREEDVARAVAIAVERFGGLDALVNNAAVGALGRVEDQTVAEWDDVLRTNVVGTLLCCRAALPALDRRGGGTIVNLSSAAAGDGFPRLAAYSASKAALVALSAALRREVRDRNVRVTTLRIHNVTSEFLSGYPAAAIAAAVGEWMREGLLPPVPTMSPGRIAETIEFVIGLPPEASIHDLDVRALGG